MSDNFGEPVSGEESFYFTTQPISNESGNITYQSSYSRGVFDGKFQEEIGRGAFGTVFKGEWEGKDAAFKFVEIKGVPCTVRVTSF